MVTSKQLSVDLFYQVSLPKSTKNFLQCMIKRRSLLSMVLCSFLGLAEAERKSRFYNHKLSFKHKRFSNKTTFSSYMLHLKSVSSEKPNLKWSTLNYVPPYSNISKKCLLCWYEKLEIVTYQNQKELLNKRCELLCICCYPNKFLLKNYTGNSFI